MSAPYCYFVILHHHVLRCLWCLPRMRWLPFKLKRLATHIAQSPTCEQVCVTCPEDIPPNAGKSNMLTQRSSTRRTRWVSSNLLPCTTNAGAVICNDVPLFSGEASAGICSTIKQQEQVHNDSEQIVDLQHRMIFFLR